MKITTAAGADTGAISAEQLENHYNAYYQTHQLKLREVRARLLKADTSFPDQTFSMLRLLKKEEAWISNSVRLHGCYFNSLGDGGDNPSPALASMMTRDFGSVEEWVEQFTAMGLCSRGWVVLGFDLHEGKLIMSIFDNHDEGMWMVFPILVLDVYEHAFQIDHKWDKTAYIKAFIGQINWCYADSNLSKASKIYEIIK